MWNVGLRLGQGSGGRIDYRRNLTQSQTEEHNSHNNYCYGKQRGVPTTSIAPHTQPAGTGSATAHMGFS